MTFIQFKCLKTTMFWAAHNWDSFLYQIIVGGVIFAAGIILPFLSGDINLKRKDDRETITWIFAAVGLFLIFLLAWQIYAIKG